MKRFVKRAIVLLIIAMRIGMAQAQVDKVTQASLIAEEAEYLSEMGEHARALVLFERCYELDPSRSIYPFNAIISALSLGDTTRANDLLSKGVQHGFQPEKAIGIAVLQAHLADAASFRFRSGWDRDREIFRARAETALIRELEAMAAADQGARRDGYTDETKRVDSLNFERLLTLVERRGFPTAMQVGPAVGNVWLLLWHHRAPEYPQTPHWQRMLPLIAKAINEGTLPASYLCMFDDFADFDAGRPMRYGTLLYYFHQQPDLLYFVDRETLDSNRASVGLGPIAWSAEMAGVDLGKARFAER